MSSVAKNKYQNIDIRARYERAQMLEQGVYNKSVAFNTTLYPHWIGDSGYFWYRRETRNGHCFRLVNAKQGVNTEAFNHAKLAVELSNAVGKKIEKGNLPISNIEFEKPNGKIFFEALEKRWCYDREKLVCEEIFCVPNWWRISPNGEKAVFIRDYNLWLKDLKSDVEKQLTFDGERNFVYGSTPTVYGRQEKVTVEAIWSPDSKKIFTQVIDSRKVKYGPPLIQYVPTDGSLRPKFLFHPRFLDEQRRVAFSGDEHIESYQFLSIDVEDNVIRFVDYPLCPVAYPPYIGYFSGGRGWWNKDSRHAYFIDQAVGGCELNLVKVDTSTGFSEIIIKEVSDCLVKLIPTSHLCALSRPLQQTNELIWLSERSGWAHLYLYDLISGKLKKIITQGDWLVRNVLRFDNKKRELFIQTAGRIKGRNPYYCDICCVDIDTGELTTILSSNHEYVVCDQQSCISFGDPDANGISPDCQHIVTTRSRVDETPVSLLLDRNGIEIQTLETANILGLPENCTWPEPVMLKAADGETDIYGVVFRPSNFDPSDTYPVLDCSYSYASPVGAFTNNHNGNGHYLSAWAYAELGFIAVVIFNRGNEGLRNVKFSSYKDPILKPDFSQMDMLNKEDSVAGIAQLAKLYPYMDLEKVGIVEFGSIPLSVAGLLIHPNFYKVGVSQNAVMDWRMMGAFHMKVADTHQLPDFANKLKGKLLIIAGILDDVVTIATTFRLVEALKNANKRFDMLILPNLTHGLTGYTIQRSWDYVVEHLLGVDPPTDFQLKSGRDSFNSDLGKC